MEGNYYDVVTCVGGALNYTFDKEQTAFSEMLRVAKPGRIVIVGVMSLLDSLIRFLPVVVEEKK
jgi:Methylase involved in ubiquinone/menaquinone biosynthesis